MNRIYLLFLFLVASISSFSQAGREIKGSIKDATTGETIIGASVMYADGKGSVTDINGNFSIKYFWQNIYNFHCCDWNWKSFLYVVISYGKFGNFKNFK